MSGLVSGLQNRVRRFESARNLKNLPEVSGRFFVYTKQVLILITDAEINKGGPVGPPLLINVLSGVLLISLDLQSDRQSNQFL